MISKQLLPYISNDDLYKYTEQVLSSVRSAADGAESRLFSNKVDPFSAVFDSLRQNISLSQWLQQEKARQIQKTMQNAIGEFHPRILGSVKQWEWLPTGGVVDVKSESRKIVAEIKNKHNTTKGSDKKSIYDNLSTELLGAYKGCTGYYVEIIPSKKERYNKAFTPSDNLTNGRRPENEKIRIIDGQSFYELVTGEKNALSMLYQVLPLVVGDILNTSSDVLVKDRLFAEFFEKVY